jgi:hypothetical protein
MAATKAAPAANNPLRFRTFSAPDWRGSVMFSSFGLWILDEVGHAGGIGVWRLERF